MSNEETRGNCAERTKTERVTDKAKGTDENTKAQTDRQTNR